MPFFPLTILYVCMGVLGQTSGRKGNVVRCSVTFLLKMSICWKQNVALHYVPKEVTWEVLVFGSCKFNNQHPLRMLSFTWGFITWLSFCDVMSVISLFTLENELFVRHASTWNSWKLNHSFTVNRSDVWEIGIVSVLFLSPEICFFWNDTSQQTDYYYY